MMSLSWLRNLLVIASCLVVTLMWSPTAQAEPGIDGDGDGLDDLWELSYFPSLASENGEGDPDGDGLTNLEEQEFLTDPTREDTDGDGLDDYAELTSSYELNPNNMDTDGDFLLDGEELGYGTDPTDSDTDNDGLTDFIEVGRGFNPVAPDTDQGGIWDGEEILVDMSDPLDPSDDQLDSDNDGITNYLEGVLGTNAYQPDSDSDWLPDGTEDANQNGLWEPDLGETNPSGDDLDGDGIADGYDTDHDGLSDGWEVLIYFTDPFEMDTDQDNLLDGEEHELSADPDYACIHPNLEDSDFDGLLDGEEVATSSPSLPCFPDSDEGGIFDICEIWDGTDPMNGDDDLGRDSDGDGLSDDYELEVTFTDPNDEDTDGDGLKDGEEHLPLDDRFVTDPNDADTDDDGILDGNEGGKLMNKQLMFGTSPIKADSDNDGLLDGLEQGLTQPQESAKDPDATDMSIFQADMDPSTTTPSRGGDKDQDGLLDGEEDKNHNGMRDPDETDPSIYDTDGDSIDDGWETMYSDPEVCASASGGPLKPLDPSDKGLDNDGDGLTNFEEYMLTKIVLGQVTKNQTNPCLWDTDTDGLRDGLEVDGTYGVWGPFGQGTDPNSMDTDGDGLDDGVEDANSDGKWAPLQETNPLRPDTDGDNLLDGAEDVNGNGLVDEGETDPNDPDTDNDGLLDGNEVNLLGTDPLDWDTDDDLLGDGLEVGKAGDVHPGSHTNPHQPDTDGDGLDDGFEDANQNGRWDEDEGETNPLNPDSDGDKLQDGLELGLVGDSDPGSTTDPLVKDSDGDGLWDSHEDKNKDGFVNDDETDPNVMDTDEGGVDDGTEVLVDGTDPLNPLDDMTADPDGDGLINSVEVELGTNRYDADTDHDTIPDNVEVGEDPADPPDSNGDGEIDAVDTDSDGDGVPDAVEAGDADPLTPPVDTDQDDLPDYLDEDSDHDYIPDAVEYVGDANNDGQPDPDADDDGKLNQVDEDSDGDGKPDLEEGTGDNDNDLIPNYLDPDDDDGPNTDTDGDGLLNQFELDHGLNPYNPDTDFDEVWDGVELEQGTDPLDGDTDDDGLADGEDGAEDRDGDGLIAALDPDSDDDGVFDGTEQGVTLGLEDFVDQVTLSSGEVLEFQISGTAPGSRVFEPDQDPLTITDHQVADTDGDGEDDGAEDPDHNGRMDEGESNPAVAEELPPADDADEDGLTDLEEDLLGLDPLDGDQDDDGLADGLEHNWRCDTDGDGLLNLVDPDSDGDGLPDGLESGVGEAGPYTRTYSLNFRLDHDPETRTYMLLADSDRGGLADGLEDLNLNGLKDEGEGDPLVPDDDGDPVWTDGDLDGLPDVTEALLHLDPLDSDSDDDGVLDGLELDATTDADRDGLVSALDPDSDNDGLPDGLESGVEEAFLSEGTALAAGNFLADLEPSTITSPLAWDTDRDGTSDSGEDVNRDGAVGEDETSPLVPDDEVAKDLDWDGITDRQEELMGLDPLDADQDDDGLRDGLEHNWAFDTDLDGFANMLDPDSDEDGLLDGTELGVFAVIPIWVGSDGQGNEVVALGTDPISPNFVVDADPLTTTWMLVFDSDFGGVGDGGEDFNLDGMLGEGETNPRDPLDDGDINPDIDGDGVPNEVEKQIGTDPFDPDSDHDNIPDGVEVGADQLNPLDSDGDGTIDALDEDSDDDTIPDSVEAGDEDLTTPPVDTDGDEIPDYLDDDSDGDGLTDKDEVTVWNTNPQAVDTDNGGADDWLETQVHHSDPNLAEDDWMGWFEDGARVQGSGCSASGTSSRTPLILVGLAVLLLMGLGRRARGFFPGLLLGLLVLAPAPAQADFHPDAKHTSVNGNQFQPAFDNSGGLFIPGTDIPEHTELRGQLWVTGLYSPLVVARDGEVLRELIKSRYEMGLAASMGLFGYLDFGVSIPFILNQDAQYPGMKLGPVSSGGLGDMTVSVKGLLLHPRVIGLGIALTSGLVLPTGDDSAYMGVTGLSWRNDLTISYSPGAGFTWLMDFGYLLQSDTSILNISDTDKILASAGLFFEPVSLVDIGVELNSWVSADRPLEKEEEIAAELAGRLRFKWEKFALSLGGAGGLTEGYGVPSWRWFAGFGVMNKANPDIDGDGILNVVDKCPTQPEDEDGFQDEDGCPDPDNDKDGVPDERDRCPMDKEDEDGFQDADGCPDPDNDGDRVPDKLDQCPLISEDLDGFQDADGCPDSDNDQDGIPDFNDKCPLEKEVYNDYQDDDGCPDKKLAQYEEKTREIKILEKVHFRFMSSEIRPESYPILDQVERVMAEHPEILLIQIEGHTDKTGPENLNKGLSDSRAKSVRQYLVDKGIKADRLTAKGFGSSRLIDYRSGPEANFNNRRVEFKVMKVKGDEEGNRRDLEEQE